MKYILALAFLLTSLLSHAQSNDVLAKAAFLKAQELYGNGDYPEAIVRLDKVKELLGSTNPRVEYLLTQCYMGSNLPDKAKASMKSYFELAENSDPNYMAMLGVIEDLEEMQAKANSGLKLAQAEQMIEDDLWQKAYETKDSTFIFAYLRKYPTSSNLAQACQLLAAYDQAPLITKEMNPIYPRQAQMMGIGAETVSLVLIDRNGLPSMIKHLEVHKLFKSAVENAIRSTIYVPASKDGKVTHGWVQRTFTFQVR